MDRADERMLESIGSFDFLGEKCIEGHECGNGKMGPWHFPGLPGSFYLQEKTWWADSSLAFSKKSCSVEWGRFAVVGWDGNMSRKGVTVTFALTISSGMWPFFPLFFGPTFSCLCFMNHESERRIWSVLEDLTQLEWYGLQGHESFLSDWFTSFVRHHCLGTFFRKFATFF